MGLMQVLFIGVLVSIFALTMSQFTQKVSRDSFNVSVRNQNLSTAMDFANFLNDRAEVKAAATLTNLDSNGGVISFH